MEMAVLPEADAVEEPLPPLALAGSDLTRSPLIVTSCWMTLLPPRIMFCVPTSVALRETLLPVS